MSPFTIVTGFAISLALSLGIVPLVLRLSKFLSLYDQPNAISAGVVRQRIHANPTPRLGGVAIVAAFFATFSIARPNFEIYSALSLSLLIFFLGMFDDLKPLSARIRLLLQIAICATAVYSGSLALDQIFVTQSISIQIKPIFGFILSTFILVGAINSLNMVDGLDGLAGGISV
ncbi:MAG: hypothetical protein NTX25_23295, partial [Proteobacteria bacterium]|nr:hypothetical protein [Pseudomonadota bacterium]